MKRRTLLLTALVASALACPGPVIPLEPCSADEQCADGRCDEGVCRAPLELVDAGVQPEPKDAGFVDAGLPLPEDAGPLDGGPAPDAGPDAGPLDAGPDAAVDAGPLDCTVPAENHYQNGDFDNNFNDWTDFAASQDIEVDPDHCDKYMRLTSNGGANPGQLFQVGATLVEGQSYLIRFDLRGPQARTCRIRIIDHDSPFGSFGYDEPCTINLDWTRFETTFTASIPGNYSGNGARFSLLAQGADTSPIDIDNIVLIPLD